MKVICSRTTDDWSLLIESWKLHNYCSERYFSCIYVMYDVTVMRMRRVQ